MDYNTGRGDLLLREFGRNIQNLAKYITTIEDRNQRTKYANAVVELMKQIVPSSKDTNDDDRPLWDDLYLLTDFKMDVDSPYPPPEKHLIGRKPKPMQYGNYSIRFRHYGRNVQLMVEEASKMENEEDRNAAIMHIGMLMKSYHLTWNKENANDAVLLKNIATLSDGKLTMKVDLAESEKIIFEPLYKEKPRPNNKNKKGHGHKSQKRRKK